jgi:mono/diheme cytochrome c family protein
MHRPVGSLLIVLILASPTGGGKVTAAEIMTPLLERVASTPKGQLKSPYRDFASVAKEGHRKYMAAGCNSCHGGAAAAWPHL